MNRIAILLVLVLVAVGSLAAGAVFLAPADAQNQAHRNPARPVAADRAADARLMRIERRLDELAERLSNPDTSRVSDSGSRAASAAAPEGDWQDRLRRLEELVGELQNRLQQRPTGRDDGGRGGEAAGSDSGSDAGIGGVTSVEQLRALIDEQIQRDRDRQHEAQQARQAEQMQAMEAAMAAEMSEWKNSALEWMADELGLGPAQLDAMGAAMDRFAAAEAEMQSAMMATLEGAMQGDGFAMPDPDTIQDLERKHEKARQAFRDDVDRVLTPDQRTRFEESRWGQRYFAPGFGPPGNFDNPGNLNDFDDR